MGDETKRLRIGGLDPAAGPEQIEGTVHADDAGQVPRPAQTRYKPELRTGFCKSGGGRLEADIAHERHIHAASSGGAVFDAEQDLIGHCAVQSAQVALRQRCMKVTVMLCTMSLC